MASRRALLGVWLGSLNGVAIGAVGAVVALGLANAFGGAGLLGLLDEADLLCWLKALRGAEGFPNTLVG